MTPETLLTALNGLSAGQINTVVDLRERQPIRAGIEAKERAMKATTTEATDRGRLMMQAVNALTGALKREGFHGGDAFTNAWSAAENAMLGLLAQADLKPADYLALTAPVAAVIPDLDGAGVAPDEAAALPVIAGGAPDPEPPADVPGEGVIRVPEEAIGGSEQALERFPELRKPAEEPTYEAGGPSHDEPWNDGKRAPKGRPLSTRLKAHKALAEKEESAPAPHPHDGRHAAGPKMTKAEAAEAMKGAAKKAKKGHEKYGLPKVSDAEVEQAVQQLQKELESPEMAAAITAPVEDAPAPAPASAVMGSEVRAGAYETVAKARKDGTWFGAVQTPEQAATNSRRIVTGCAHHHAETAEALACAAELVKAL